jgi:hypothetical protein
MLTPAWRLEFYQGHAYVCISLFGFPDQIAPSIIYGLGDLVATRLPNSVNTLRSDAATLIATKPPPSATATFEATHAPNSTAFTQPASVSASKDHLAPLSYTAPAGEIGMVSYFDDTGSQLTDGIFGVDDILADQGLGTAYEWVGWTESSDPITLTFTFTGEVNLSMVEIGFNHREGLGIFVPELVTINGMRFSPAPDEVGNNQRKDVIFEGPFTGSTLQITLQHRGRGWILIDEVRFIPGKE